MKKFALVLAFTALSTTVFAHDMHSGKEALDALYPDHDGTLTWKEVHSAVITHYHTLNDESSSTDKEILTSESKTSVVTLLKKEARKHVNADHDVTLNLADYLAIAHYRFKLADKDHEGSLSETELNTPEGKNLLRMMQKPVR